MENRNGLIVAAMAIQADGRAERNAGLLMARGLGRKRRRATMGADKAYDSRDFVRTLRELNITPHVRQRRVGTALDGRTTRQPGYPISLHKRWRVEKPFGWLESIPSLRQVKLRGLENVGWLFVFGCAAYNLLRIPRLRARYA